MRRTVRKVHAARTQSTVQHGAVPPITAPRAWLSGSPRRMANGWAGLGLLCYSMAFLQTAGWSINSSFHLVPSLGPAPHAIRVVLGSKGTLFACLNVCMFAYC